MCYFTFREDGWSGCGVETNKDIDIGSFRKGYGEGDRKVWSTKYPSRGLISLCVGSPSLARKRGVLEEVF